jgi:hypothetical protein
LLEEETLAVGEEIAVAAGGPKDDVGVGTPEVNGGAEADEAPEKAGEPSVADEAGEAVLLMFRTLELD